MSTRYCAMPPWVHAQCGESPRNAGTLERWNEIYCGMMTIEVDGWQITFFIDCGDLDYCDSCLAPDGRKYEFSSRDAFDPIALLTPDEHRQLEELLRQI